MFAHRLVLVCLISSQNTTKPFQVGVCGFNHQPDPGDPKVRFTLDCVGLHTLIKHIRNLHHVLFPVPRVKHLVLKGQREA